MNDSEIADFWLNVVPGWALAEALFFVADRRVADVIGDDPTDISVIAEKTATNPDAMQRLLNTLCSRGIFQRTGKSQFSPTPLSRPLRSDTPDSQRAYIALGHRMIKPSWSMLDHSMETGEPAFDTRFGAPPFDYMKDNESMAQAFAEGMTSTTKRSERALMESDAFGEFDLVVDVGGSFGSLLELLLKTRPTARGIVFDCPEIADQAARRWAERENTNFSLSAAGGNFFDSVIAGGDLYLLKQILHDWPDDACGTILGNIRSAMASGGRIAVIEMILPEDGAPHPGWIYDLLMMTITGGRERSLKQYEALLEGEGFAVERVVTTASPLSVIVARPQ